MKHFNFHLYERSVKIKNTDIYLIPRHSLLCVDNEEYFYGLPEKDQISIKQWIKGLPYIFCAILARGVRFVSRIKGSKLEELLMIQYYIGEARILGNEIK